MIHDKIEGQPIDLTGRREERQVTVLINAAVSQGRRDSMCRIRNVSAGGIAIETGLPLVVGDPAAVTLHSGRVLQCIVRWAEDNRAGVSCEDITADVLRAETAIVPVKSGPAIPRFARTMAMEIAVRGKAYACTMQSISASDILVSGGPAFEQGLPVTICLRGFYIGSGTMREEIGEHLLIAFASPVAFRVMDPWLVATSPR